MTWVSFNPTHSGLGALIKHARKNGYVSQRDKALLKNGSQIEVARLLCTSLEENYSLPIYTESSFWSYSKTHWHQLDTIKVRQLVQTFDGAKYGNSKLKLCVIGPKAPPILSNTNPDLLCSVEPLNISGLVHKTAK